MSSHPSNQARVIPLHPVTAAQSAAAKEPLWRHVIGDVLRHERRAQERTLKEVADRARISMPYLSEVERGRKEASSEVLAAAAHALGLGLTDLLALAQARLARAERTRLDRARTAAGPADGTGTGALAAAPGEENTSVMSVAGPSARRAAPRAPSAQGEVRLAA